MLYSPRIRLKALVQLCQRLATATKAGLEDRKIWRSEAGRGHRVQRAAAGQVADALAQGRSLADALPATGEFFPPMFTQLAAIGETSGQLDRAYARLAEHYAHLLAARRSFAGQMAWPAIQLGITLLVVGLLIYIMGVLPVNRTAAGPKVDLLGWGLFGSRGLFIYLNVIILATLAAAFVVASFSRRMAWTMPLERLALRLPIVGSALQTLALARFTWSLQLVLDTSMDLRKALPLALDAAGVQDFSRHSGDVARAIGQGRTVHEALASTGAFPQDLLDAIAVGEESGMLVETMRRQSHEYQERAGIALRVLAQGLGYLLWAGVAVFIITLIFRLASFYLNTINSLM